MAHFSGICEEEPEEVEFGGTKYTGKLWKYWISQESNSNFPLDVMNRESKVRNVHLLFSFETLSNYFEKH